MDNRTISQGLMVRVGFAVFGLLTLATLVLTLVSERGWFAVREREQELMGLEQRIEEMETSNESMRDEIENLNDPYAGEIERRAREELNLVRPDESIMSYPSNDPDLAND